MAFRIKTISDPQGNRCDVTVEEIDAQGNPTGRERSERLGLLPIPDWAGLKTHFEKYFKEDDARIAAIETLRTEADDAKVAQLDLTATVSK